MAADHVVLVGLMATGKTTIGRRLAKRLDRPFVDADAELEARSGLSVRELYAKEGEAGVRALESELLGELLDATEPHVIATGGGVVVSPENRERLKRSGSFVVWLDADPEFLASRAAGKTTRPLLDGDPVGTLRRLSSERAPWYAEVADVRIDIHPAFREQEKPKDHLSFVLARLVDERSA
jgi:shikimate kinase